MASTDEEFSIENPLRNALKSVKNIGVNLTTDKSSNQKLKYMCLIVMI